MIYFTLYSRSYCHLCEDMRMALVDLVSSTPFQIAIVDVDQDPALLALYDELVPVLFGRKVTQQQGDRPGEQLCHYFLDVAKIKAFCDE